MITSRQRHARQARELLTAMQTERLEGDIARLEQRTTYLESILLANGIDF